MITCAEKPAGRANPGQISANPGNSSRPGDPAQAAAPRRINPRSAGEDPGARGRAGASRGREGGLGVGRGVSV